MPYSELIKSFGGIRQYMREFYIYGFRSRGHVGSKSARSYDNERRRVESWLGDYMRFGRNAEGKNIFISIDSRSSCHNPLYSAWKAKSFTDGDITLHFILFDILDSPSTELTLSEIVDRIYGYTDNFEHPRNFDISTVRKKLGEYIGEGIITAEKRGRTLYYRRADDVALPLPRQGVYDAVDFFSEVAPCGVIGSFLHDKFGPHSERLSFKHHYITGALDSEILCTLFGAMREKRFVSLSRTSRFTGRKSSHTVVPLRVMISARNGRQHLMAYNPTTGRISGYRTDYIDSAEPGGVCESFDRLRAMLDGMSGNMWGVSTQSRSGSRLERVEFTVKYEPWQRHIHHRLEREKRCGSVEKLNGGASRFCADVYDASEMIPWVRTFIGRLSEVSFSDPKMQQMFEDDIAVMCSYYGVDFPEGGSLSVRDIGCEQDVTADAAQDISADGQIGSENTTQTASAEVQNAATNSTHDTSADTQNCSENTIQNASADKQNTAKGGRER